MGKHSQTFFSQSFFSLCNLPQRKVSPQLSWFLNFNTAKHFTLFLEKFTKIHCVSQEKYHISYVHNTHKKYTPEYLTWWKYFINGSTLHSLFWNHWWDTWLVGFLIRVIMLQTLIHKSVWILFKIIDKVPCSQYTHKNTHLNIWLDGSISLMVPRCILCSEIIGGILG